MSEKNIFEKIIDREIEADIVYEDAQVLAFRDINPQAPVHVLVIPKRRVTALSEVTWEDTALMGHLLATAAEVARQLELAEGFRVVINSGRDGGQSVDHLHLHLLGGRALSWPPG